MRLLLFLATLLLLLLSIQKQAQALERTYTHKELMSFGCKELCIHREHEKGGVWVERAHKCRCYFDISDEFLEEGLLKVPKELEPEKWHDPTVYYGVDEMHVPAPDPNPPNSDINF